MKEKENEKKLHGSMRITFLKLFLYAQSVVGVLYPVHVSYSVRSFYSAFNT